MTRTASGLTIFARSDRDGNTITETECGAWTMVHGLGVEDDAGDLHPRNGDGADMVAELLSMQTNESITAADVRRCWAATRA